MNENLNLCEILKGHEGETFYSPMCGKISFCCIDRDSSYPIKCIRGYKEINFTDKGEYFKDDYGECLIFPSKDQRDWNKWVEEQKPKVPKTWREIKDKHVYYLKVCKDLIELENWATQLTPIEKSALALLKIHQLIEVGYGGSVNKTSDNVIHSIIYDFDSHNFIIVTTVDLWRSHISFHTKEQAKEFLKYIENIGLLKDYFMI